MAISDSVQERSYLIWEREGRPNGRSLEHWRMAEAELQAEREAKAKAGRAKRTASPAKPAGKSAPKTAVKLVAKPLAAKPLAAKPGPDAARHAPPRDA